MAFEIDEMFVSLGLRMNKFQKGLSEARGQLTKAGKAMTDVGKKLSLTLTAPLTALGAFSVKTFAQFEQGMNRVRAVTGAAGSDFKALETQAKMLGATTQFSAVQASEAMGALGLAGFKATEIMDAMPSVLTTAASAQLSMGQAADITAKIMRGFGLESDQTGRISDVLAKSFTSANTDLTQLGEAFKVAGPVAKAFGLSLENTSASLSLMADAGFTGGMAGTALRGALVRLAKPAAEAAAIFKRIGFEAIDPTTGKMKDMATVVGQLQNAQLTASEVMTIFGQRAGPAMSALLARGSADLSKFTTMLENSGGTAEKIANIQMAGLSGSLVRLRSAFEGVRIAIGEAMAPVVDKLAKGLTKLSNWFTSLSATGQRLVVVFGAMLAALGPMLVAFGLMTMALGQTVGLFNALTIAGPKILTLFSGLSKILPVMNTAFAAMSIKLMAVAAVFVLLANLASIIYQNWETLKQIGSDLVNDWSGAFSILYDNAKAFIVDGFKQIWEWFVNLLGGVGTSIGNWVTTAAKFWYEAYKTAKKWLVEKMAIVMNALLRMWNKMAVLWDGAVKPMEVTFDKFTDDIGKGLEWTKDKFKVAFDESKKSAVKSMSEAKSYVMKTIADMGKSVAIKLGVTTVQKTGGAGTGNAPPKPTGEQADPNVFMNQMKTNLETMKPTMDAFWANWNEKASDSQKSTLSTWQNLVGPFNSITGELAQAGSQLWNSFTQGFGNAVAEVIMTGKSFFDAMKQLMKNIAQQIISMLIQILIKAIIVKAVLTGLGIGGAPLPMGGGLSIPGFAEGGVVTGPTLAMVGEKGPEAIIPLDDLDKMGGGQQTIIVELNGRALTTEVVKNMPSVLRVRAGVNM